MILAILFILAGLWIMGKPTKVIHYQPLEVPKHLRRPSPWPVTPAVISQLPLPAPARIPAVVITPVIVADDAIADTLKALRQLGFSASRAADEVKGHSKLAVAITTALRKH